MFLLSQTPFCLTAANSVVMFNSTTAGRWPFLHYFEYNIVRGPGNTRVEWIPVYIPGPWQPVAESTLGPAPDDSSTYREWRMFYHFEVYWPRDSTGGTSPSRSPMRPFIHGITVTGASEDTNDSAIHPSIARPVFPSGSPSSSASSVSDGGWRPPSPPYDPNFDWGK